MFSITKPKLINILIRLGIILFAVILSRILAGDVILPQILNLGWITIHYYGLIMALAVGIGYWIATKRTTSFGISNELADNIIFWVIIFGFIGARLYHIASSFNYYIVSPGEMLKVWNGGLSIYGAVLGGLFGLYFVLKIYTPTEGLKLSVLKVLDWLTPSLIVGQIIGRFGNMFNYEAYGYPTNFPWKMFVPEQFRTTQYISSSYFHPFFLYEVLGNIFIFIVLLYLEGSGAKMPKKDGSLFIFYLLLYNILRFCLEFIRIDSTFIGIFRLNAIVSLLLIVFSIIYFVRYRNNVKVP